MTVTNTFRPVVYVRKTLESAPADHRNDPFTFRIRTGADGTMQPLKGSTFYYVDSVRTDGGIPRILTNADGTLRTGRTNADDGTFTIRAGEIIALFPGQVGTAYEVEEINVGADWICQEPLVTGNASTAGTRAEIRNFYKWKELHLTKEITHQNAELCTEAFTFRIQRSVIEDGVETLTDLTREERDRINAAGIRLIDPATGADVPVTEPIRIQAEGLLETGQTTFTCACAGKTIVIPMLEAGVTYKITEIVQEGSNYLPMTGSVKVTMQLYGEKSERTIINDYQLRTLSVSKEVIGQTAGAAAGDEFTMEVKIGGELLANQAYTLMQNGNPVEGNKTSDWRDGKYQTDEKGQIHIKDGMTAVFTDIGRVGQSYAVRELVDGTKYMQLVPAEKDGYTGIFGGSDLEAKFMNADLTGGNKLYIRKEYVAAEGDEAAKAYVEKLKAEPEMGIVSMNSSINYVTQGISYQTCIEIFDQVNGTFRNRLTYSGVAPHFSIPTLKANEMAIVTFPNTIPNDDVERTYTVTEAPEFQHQIKSWTYDNGDYLQDVILSISQKTPANDQSFTGIVGQDSVATIVNEVRSISANNKITKEMTQDSDPVPENAQLTWLVERYNGYTWEPADGVSYVTAAGAWNMDPRQQNEIFTDDCVQTTRSDGLIRLYKLKKEDGERDRWPAVYFQEPVLMNAYQGGYAKDDLRVTEVMGGQATHEKWGLLTGYRAPSGEVTMTLPNLGAGGFINSNHTEPVTIRKELPPDTPECTETFTMQLKQVLSLFDESDIQESDILASEGRSGIPYTLHDPETGSSSRTTGSGGAIYLKAGQYATLNLPVGTLWTVSEEQDYRYPLYEMKPENNTPTRLKELNKNLMLIGQAGTSAQNTYKIRYYNGDRLMYTATYYPPYPDDPAADIQRCWDGKISSGMEGTDLPDGTEDGLIFVGWSHDPKASEPDLHVGDSLPTYTGDVDLYAVWKEAVKLTLIYEGRQETVDVEKGSTYDCRILGQRQIGWSLSKNGRIDYPTNSIGPVNKDMTLYAIYDDTYKTQGVTYTVTNAGGKKVEIALKCRVEYKGKGLTKTVAYLTSLDGTSKELTLPIEEGKYGSNMSKDPMTTVRLTLEVENTGDVELALPTITWGPENEVEECTREDGIDEEAGVYRYILEYESWPGEERNWTLDINFTS